MNWEIEALTGRRIIPMTMDVTSRAGRQHYSRGREPTGGLDILINSASLPGGSRSVIGPIEGLDGFA